MDYYPEGGYHRKRPVPPPSGLEGCLWGVLVVALLSVACCCVGALL